MENPQQDGNPHGRQDTNESANKIATPSGSEELGPTSHDVAIGILNNFNTSDHQSRDYEPSRPRSKTAEADRRHPSTRPGSSKRPTSPATRVDIQKINTANLNRNRSGTMESIASEADTSQLINLLDEWTLIRGKMKRNCKPETLKHIERFTMLLVKALQGFGCPTHMLDFHAGEVAKGLGHPASFAIFPSFIIANLCSQSAKRYLFILLLDLNVYKLQLIKELCKRVSNYKKDGKGIEVGMMGSVASLAQRNSIVQGMSITVRPPTLLEGPSKKATNPSKRIWTPNVTAPRRR
ncbi:hypothetical protein BDR26DRAFT_935278 [Obelidium mucronatum]|nr:hypothetical protein BDR26DRAFT_935278 [Obelidium mucronatum]